jgi:hypothetical protein
MPYQGQGSAAASTLALLKIQLTNSAAVLTYIT